MSTTVDTTVKMVELIDALTRENSMLKRQLEASDAVERDNNNLIDGLMTYIESLENELAFLHTYVLNEGDNNAKAETNVESDRNQVPNRERCCVYMQSDSRFHGEEQMLDPTMRGDYWYT